MSGEDLLGEKACGMAKYGPTKGEHLFRLGFSLFGLAGIGVGLWIHGFALSPLFFETVVLGGGFFLASAGWSGWKLWTRDWAE